MQSLNDKKRKNYPSINSDKKNTRAKKVNIDFSDWFVMTLKDQFSQKFLRTQQLATTKRTSNNEIELRTELILIILIDHYVRTCQRDYDGSTSTTPISAEMSDKNNLLKVGNFTDVLIEFQSSSGIGPDAHRKTSIEPLIEACIVKSTGTLGYCLEHDFFEKLIQILSEKNSNLSKNISKSKTPWARALFTIALNSENFYPENEVAVSLLQKIYSSYDLLRNILPFETQYQTSHHFDETRQDTENSSLDTESALKIISENSELLLSLIANQSSETPETSSTTDIRGTQELITPDEIEIQTVEETSANTQDTQHVFLDPISHASINLNNDVFQENNGLLFPPKTPDLYKEVDTDETEGHTQQKPSEIATQDIEGLYPLPAIENYAYSKINNPHLYGNNAEDTAGLFSQDFQSVQIHKTQPEKYITRELTIFEPVITQAPHGSSNIYPIDLTHNDEAVAISKPQSSYGSIFPAIAASNQANHQRSNTLKSNSSNNYPGFINSSKVIKEPFETNLIFNSLSECSKFQAMLANCESLEEKLISYILGIYFFLSIKSSNSLPKINENDLNTICNKQFPNVSNSKPCIKFLKDMDILINYKNTKELMFTKYYSGRIRNIRINSKTINGDIIKSCITEDYQRRNSSGQENNTDKNYPSLTTSS